MVSSSEKKKRIDLRQYALLVVTALLLVLIACFTAGDIGFNNEEAFVLCSGWTFVKSDGSRQEVTLPANLDTAAGETTVIETVLPSYIPTQSTICLRASMQFVRAYLDDALIYEFGTDGQLLSETEAGSAWVLFRLPDDSQSKTLRIELTSPYDSFSGKIGSIYCSSKASILFDIFGTYAIGFFVFVALAIIGIILLVMFLSTAVPGLRNPTLLYLALFSITVGLWIFGESKTAQFFIGNEYLVTKLSFYALLVMPLPFTLYLDNAYQRHTPAYLPFFFWLFTVNLVVCIVLELTGMADFFQTLLSVHLMLSALLIVTIAALLVETIKYHNRDAWIQLIGLCILGLSGVLELISVWLNSYNLVSYFFRIGILLYVAYIGIATFRRLLTLAQESREAEYFERLAFTDVVTEGNNRMAFERDAGKAFVHGGADGNWLVLFDLDHLKTINDTIGHQTGDDAIRLAYRCITAAFTNVGTCYRIGGDEYACIVCSAAEKTMDGCFNKLDELVRQSQEKVPYDFGISYGKGIFDPKTEDFRTFFVDVDKRLYANKEKRHQIPPIYV